MLDTITFGPTIQIRRVYEKGGYFYEAACPERTYLTSEGDSAQEAYDNLIYLIDRHTRTDE